MTEHRLVLLADPRWRHPAETLARELGIAWLPSPDALPLRYLHYDDAGLALIEGHHSRRGGSASFSRISCDFVGGAARHRRLYGGGTGQVMARAVGLSSRFKPLVADLTAGMGRDGFALATLGARVIWAERHPIVAALLADGLHRLRVATESAPRPAGDEGRDARELVDIAARLSLYALDGRTWLEDPGRRESPDVIYLDPMFPPRDKSAAVKKEMAAFHHLVGSDDDAGELLSAALTAARYRVVVKRPRRAPSLAGRQPSFSLAGKTTRFDVFSLAKLPGWGGGGETDLVKRRAVFS